MLEYIGNSIKELNKDSTIRYRWHDVIGREARRLAFYHDGYGYEFVSKRYQDFIRDLLFPKLHFEE